MKACCFYESPVGMLGDRGEWDRYYRPVFRKYNAKPYVAAYEYTFVAQAINQLEAYFSGERTAFDLPLVRREQNFNVRSGKRC